MLERSLELAPSERLHDVGGRAECDRLAARSVDAHAEDRETREPSPDAAGKPHARTGCRLQEQQIRLHPLGPFPRADRRVTESLTEHLEERTGRGVGVDDEDGGHIANVDAVRRERRILLV